MSNELNSSVNYAEKKYCNLEYVPPTCDPGLRPKILKNILDDIGNTPLVQLNRIPQKEGIKCDMYVKCEYLNHGGSVKDRIAYRMVTDAENEGTLIPGQSVIIEPTSGNTGIGLALVAVVKGYKCTLVLPEKNSQEKVNTLLALGANVVKTPDVPASSSHSDINVAKKLVTNTPGGVMLNQFDNCSNPKAHYHTTAEEILWSLDNNVDMVVIGAGTCGTLCGIAKKVKERCPKCIVVGVDPYGSILSPPTETYDFEVEGIGDDFYPKILNKSLVDEWVKTNDKNSFIMARRLIVEEGILCGGSSGAAMWAAIQKAKTLKSGQRCVVIMPDSIRNYMTKFVSDPWMEVRGFKDLFSSRVCWWKYPVSKKWIRQTPSVSYKSKVTEALDALKQSNAPLVNIIDDNGSLIGVFTANNTRRCLANQSYTYEDSLDNFTMKRFYKVDLAQKIVATLGLVSRMLDLTPFVVVINTDTVSYPSIVYRPVGAIFPDNLPL